jgi:ELWxxDGT repeat protein
MYGFLRRSTFLLTLLAGLAGPAYGQTASLVEDINTASPWNGVVTATDLLGLSGEVLFAAGGSAPAIADGAGSGSELLAGLRSITLLGRLDDGSALFTSWTDRVRLYRSDGTRAGTYAVGEIGASDLLQKVDVVLARDRVYFVRRELNQAPELWLSDGTPAGTRKVPFPAGANPPSPLEMAGVGRRVFLLNRQNELWVSDGTAGGTVLLHAFGDRDGVGNFAAGATRLYFSAWVNGVVGGPRALWTSDGTPALTLPVPGFPLLQALDFKYPLPRTVGDRAYLALDDFLHGELWATDGTAASSRRVSDFGDGDPFGTDLGFPPPFVAELSGRVVFATEGGLWASAATAGAPTLLAPVGEDVRSGFVQVGNRALFLGRENGREELWATDGTATGTARLAITCPDLSCGPFRFGLVAVQGAAYFLVADSQSLTLWRSDGTAAGTRRYSDVLPSLGDLTHLAAIGRQVFFLAGSAAPSRLSLSLLWTSDGQPGGTHPVPGSTSSGASSSPRGLVAAGGRLFFTACDGTTRQVWASDGTAAGTAPLATLSAALTGCSGTGFSPEILGITPYGNQVFFWVPDRVDPTLLHLFRADSAGNAQELALNHVSLSPGPPLQLVPFAGEVFYVGSVPGFHGLFRSDGTIPGTRSATELAAIPNPIAVTTAAGLLFVTSSSGSTTEVWASDGTAAGTRRLLSGPFALSSGAVELPSAFLQAGPWTYFFLAEPGVGSELWRTDATAAGTARLAIVSPHPEAPVAFAGALYFFADDADGRGLYRADPANPAGVTLLRRFVADRATFFDTIPPPAVFAGRLFFAAADGVHGRALWATDGTPGGTVLVRAVSSSPEASGLSQLTPAGDRLFFTAWDFPHGVELWQSDGTAAGTRLAADLAPEGASSSPDQLTAAGDRLFFTADDGVTGRELWTFPLSGAASCQPSDTRLCLAASRFRVEIAWKDFQGHTGVGHAVTLTADTGYFWFFDPANVETVVKVLDARALNGAFWVFYGALSNVEYEITVTDTATGLTHRYFNPSGRLASVGDTAGFGPLGAYAAKTITAPPSSPPLVAARTDTAAATSVCVPGPQRLCLQGGRFAVEAAWKDFQGKTGTGTAVPLSGDTGYFWFFAPTNVEVIAKVLDGRALGGKFWFFYGALSNVEYTLTVTDTQTGAVKTYRNPSGQFGSVADTGAF